MKRRGERRRRRQEEKQGGKRARRRRLQVMTEVRTQKELSETSRASRTNQTRQNAEHLPRFMSLQQTHRAGVGLTDNAPLCLAFSTNNTLIPINYIALMFRNRVLTSQKLYHLKSGIFVFIKRCNMVMIQE